ncbi:helix-turn-helix domain-containing protein [Patescibacteria group bacterium]|nr:helix-turn-helix domain-containing protein [Patescibacteria group bacterium]
MTEFTISTPDLVTFAEAAKILGVSRPTIYSMVAKLELHPLAIGKNRYLMHLEVERLKNAKIHERTLES